MIATENKAIVTSIYDALAEGDGRPFIEAMAEDFSWTAEGRNSWGRTWQGKDSVRRELLGPLFDQFATTYRCRAHRIIAEGDTVVVLARGEVTTKAGKPYNNSYALVITMRDGKMAAMHEYLDTELVSEVLKPLSAPAD